MFCSKCGHKNAEAAKFCGGCGASTVGSTAAPAATVESVSAPKAPKEPKGPAKKILGLPLPAAAGIAGVVVVAIVVAVVLVFGGKPMPTSKDAENFVITKADFDGASVQTYDSPYSLSEGDHFFYPDACAAREDSVDAAANGDVWTTIGFEEKSSVDQTFEFSQTIYSFDNEADATAFVDSVASGNDDSDCDSPNIDDFYEDGGTLKDTFGVDLPGVYSWDNYSGNDSGLILAQRGKIVTEIYFYFDDEASDPIAQSDVDGYVTAALERFAGIRRD